MANRYSRALRQIKDKTLDEKLQLLSEIPTNNTAGIFVDTPGTLTPERTEPGDIDTPLDLDQDGDGADGYEGDDTTGLFQEDGTIRSIEPPGDTSYVLGPMISMWYAWANYTQIGYVRQSDRKMVNLGRITGELADWDEESGFTSYGQLTLEQAVWYKNQSRSDYRAFYPGPPSNPADEFGRYLGSIVDTTKSVFNLIKSVFTPGENTGFDPSDVFSSILGLILRSDDSSFVDALKSLGVAGKVYLSYLTNQLPNEIDNTFLGQDYVDRAFEDMQLSYDRNGNPISVVKDNVIGSGQNPQYDPTKNLIEVEFNYDFDTNAQAIAKEPEKYNYEPGLNRLAMNTSAILGGDYGLDSVPVPLAGWFTQASKSMGGAQHRPGKITISPADLQQKNPTLFNQLVQRGDIPSDAVNKPSQKQEASREGSGAEVDPEKAVESLKNSLPADQRAQLDFQQTMSMDNFNKLSKSDQNKVMNALQDRHKSRSDGSNFKDAPKYMKDRFKASAKEAGKTKFKDGYMVDKDPNTGKTRKTPIFSTIPGMSSVLAMGHKPSGKLLTESQKRVLRDIKKPVQVKEIPSKVKVSPKLRNKNKTVGGDMMKIPDTPAQYKPQTNIWGKADYAANVRSSQEKKNQVLELVGAAEHHWTYLTEDRRRKHQEKVNEMMSAEYDKQMELLYEKHKIKESKINKVISAFKKPTDIKPEFPKDPPPQMDSKTGMHPKYGKNYKHDKLDPHSAEFMPPTGDPVIDANIKRATNAKEKARKLKILLGKKA